MKKDLTGRVFGKLTALTPLEERSGTSVVWRCRCSCGQECDVSANYLKKGRQTACAECSGKKKIPGTRTIDLTGLVFGKLEVVNLAGKDKWGQAVWHCKCSCGQECDVPANALKLNRKKSCGKCRHRSPSPNAAPPPAQHPNLPDTPAPDRRSHIEGCRVTQMQGDAIAERKSRARTVKNPSPTGSLKKSATENLSGENAPPNMQSDGKCAVLDASVQNVPEPLSVTLNEILSAPVDEWRSKLASQLFGSPPLPVTRPPAQRPALPDAPAPNRRSCIEDLTGKAFGALTAIELMSNNRNGEAVWRCRCSCGQECDVPAYALKMKRKLSCGKCQYPSPLPVCSAPAPAQHPNPPDAPALDRRSRIEDLTGKTFGALTVIELLPHNRNGGAVWRCRCACGNECEVWAAHLRAGLRRACEECQPTQMQKRLGIAHPPAKKQNAPITNQELFAHTDANPSTAGSMDEETAGSLLAKDTLLNAESGKEAEAVKIIPTSRTHKQRDLVVSKENEEPQGSALPCTQPKEEPIPAPIAPKPAMSREAEAIKIIPTSRTHKQRDLVSKENKEPQGSALPCAQPKEEPIPAPIVPKPAMSRRVIDLTGRVFGQLTVVGLLPQRQGGKAVWHCRCTCGGECDVRSDYLRSGWKGTCGICDGSAKVPGTRTDDITAQRFGFLVAIERHRTRKDGRAIWTCRCDCGNLCYVPSDYLKKGAQTSCRLCSLPKTAIACRHWKERED